MAKNARQRWRSAGIGGLLQPLRQPQHNAKDEEGQVHTLSRVDDDGHPGSAEAPCRECIKQDTANDGS
jgi:hypothetical protein